MKRTRVLMADDHSLILKGIAGLLDQRYEIVGLAENGKALLEAAGTLKPDVVVLDISMPILNGIDATREIKKALPSAKVIVLTMHSNAIYLRKALEAGASGYVLKAGAAEELLAAMDTALKGGVYVTPRFGKTVLDSVIANRPRPSRATVELTDRQRQILQLVAEGKQNKEIAGILHVSIKTVEFHRSRLMAKMGAQSVAELTVFAIQEGVAGEVDRPN